MPRHQGGCSRLSVFTLLLAAAALPALGQGLVPPSPPNQPKGALSPLANARAIRLAPGVATIARAMPAVQPLHANAVLEDIKRTPIPHQAFQLIDPKTRRIVGPSDNITLPDGRVVPAGAYYKELNALESWLNGAGHTLKNKEALPVLRRTAINATLLSSQSKQIGAFHKVLPKIDLQRIKPTAGAAPIGSQIQSMVSQGDAQKLGLSPQQYQDGLKSLSGANLTSAAPAHMAKAAVAPLFKPAGTKLNAAIAAVKVRKPIHKTYPFDFEVGSAGTFQAYLRGRAPSMARSSPSPRRPPRMTSRTARATSPSTATPLRAGRSSTRASPWRRPPRISPHRPNPIPPRWMFLSSDRASST